MHDKGIVLVPTLWPREILPIPRAMRARPDIDVLVNGWVAEQRAKLDRARKAGVKIAFGSDMWYGYPDKTRGQATRLVLEALASFGVSPADALRMATVDAGRPPRVDRRDRRGPSRRVRRSPLPSRVIPWRTCTRSIRSGS